MNGGAGEHRRRWYPLDNTAVIFPPIISPQFTTLFRVSAELTQAVRLRELTTAVAQLYRRAPYLCVRLRTGIFWHYLEETAAVGPLGDVGFPCTEHPRLVPTRPLLVVRCRHRRITLEISHVLTDGGGARLILQSLLVMYRLACLGSDGEHPEMAAAVSLLAEAREMDLLVPGDPPAEWEQCYGSREMGSRRIPAPPRYTPAWHSDGPNLAAGEYRVTTVRYPTAALREVARSSNVSLTDLGVALYAEALQERYFSRWRRRRERRPIRILVPVDMRPHTGLKTVRNFFVFVLVELDQRLGSYSFAEILRKVHFQLRAELDPRTLKKQIIRNVRAERNWFNRIIPVFAKDWVLRRVHRVQGEATNTGSFSNLGSVPLPASLSPHVRTMDFVPPPSTITGINVTMISYGEKTAFTFGSVREDTGIERFFCSRLASFGLTGELVSNGVATRQSTERP